MPDRKKVLELVESIIVHAEDERTNRSWETDDIGWKNIDKIWGCSQQLKELLKEQEAKTGKWILDDEDANSWECSECGGLLLINDGTPHENDWYFCPYCGSKLEEQAVKLDD